MDFLKPVLLQPPQTYRSLAGEGARAERRGKRSEAGEAMSATPDADSVDALRSQIDSLQTRVNELEVQNARLSSQLSRCCCRKVEDEISSAVDGGSVVDGNGKSTNVDKKTRKKKDFKTGILEHHPRRYVALRLMYFGQRFYGFASEAQLDPTVESEIFKALEKTKLLVGDKKKSLYSRCGRTDKGVSSFGQVISLFLRSNLRPKDTDDANSWELSTERDVLDAEIDYVRVLNRVLPKDIRVTGWCPVPIDFSARFSCMSRDAGQKFVGDHDFRNFCKMDAFNVHNYRRHITSFELSSCDKRLESKELWYFKIKGSAFLWHQVRCMVAVMFMVGQGLESPNVIDALLDTDGTPRKPQYTMAPEMPLILQSCEFQGVRFICSSDARQALHVHLEEAYQTYELQAALTHEALLSCLPQDHGCSDQSLLGTHQKKKGASHISLMSRPTEPSYEERRAKLNRKVEGCELSGQSI
ncbi:tRNA pseudouridine synthase [Psidium guajava]|nr:tRNA pseudouridine synthase [Psidium guajava]